MAVTAVAAVTAVTAAPAATHDVVMFIFTEITAPITAVTVPVTAITAPITAATAQAQRADVGTPERRRLLELHRRSRASEAATRQAYAWRQVTAGDGTTAASAAGGAPFTRVGREGQNERCNDVPRMHLEFVLVGTLGHFILPNYF